MMTVTQIIFNSLFVFDSQLIPSLDLVPRSQTDLYLTCAHPINPKPLTLN